MKLLKNSIYIILCFLTLMRCDEDSTAGISRITYFPDFTYNGEELVIIEKGTEFNDPGVTASESGNSIPVTVSASGAYFGGNSLDVTKPDIYTVSYSATNSDGFASSKNRTVIVAGQGDLMNNIEGLYTSTVGRDAPPTAQYTDMEYVLIRKTGDNTYELSDGIGGYYDLGRAYGILYAAQPALITANNIAINDFTFGPAFGVGLFGGVANIVSMAVNPVTKTITFTTEWQVDAATLFTFDVTLKQVEL